MNLEFLKLNQCPLCGRDNPSIKYKLSEFNILGCPCGFKFMNPALHPQSMMEIYQSSETLFELNPYLKHYYEYDTLNASSKTYREYLYAINQLQHHTPGRRLIEIGCGSGSFLKLAKEKGWEVFGLDSSPENIVSLKKSNIGAFQSSFFDYKTELKFDAVVLWDFIEHTHEPFASLKKVKEILNPRGVILIATPNDSNLLTKFAELLYTISGGKIIKPLEKFYVLEHPIYFNIITLSELFSRGRFNLLKSWQTSTDLNRYEICSALKICLQLVFMFAVLINMQTRLMAIARLERD